MGSQDQPRSDDEHGGYKESEDMGSDPLGRCRGSTVRRSINLPYPLPHHFAHGVDWKDNLLGAGVPVGRAGGRLDPVRRSSAAPAATSTAMSKQPSSATR
ncbi:hypothetical protein PSPO01_14629 [Paraphaeosphaeria sporulosa]